MKPKIKAMWIEALRGGKYKQCRGDLHKVGKNGGKGSYCCLGVLCDLHRKEKGQKWYKSETGDQLYLGEADELPADVAKWAGLDSVNGSYYGGCRSLIVDNDDEKHSFKHIADTIENNF